MHCLFNFTGGMLLTSLLCTITLVVLMSIMYHRMRVGMSQSLYLRAGFGVGAKWLLKLYKLLTEP